MDMELQEQSPLFTKVPAEIRNQIFEIALQPYYDPNGLYERNTEYTRPGSLGRKKVDVALLRTCKRVYAETKVVSFGNLEVEFYLGHASRVPPSMCYDSLNP